ncbi:MAG TPA: 30S ribosomal protein S3ae [Thermoplasmatales archaeon]|nr:30S ribosomal protein S3ae [Thermoplasmatales archaeon]
MAKAKARAAAKKLKDKWKAKVWYRVLAPALFNNVAIAETPAADKELLINRVTEVSLQDLTGDFRKSHVKLYFKIDRVEGTDAYTYFIGHTLTNDYVRRLIRRRRSRIDGVYDATTKDGAVIRVKPLATTERRIQSSQKHKIREIMKEVIFSYAKERTLDELIKSIIEDELPKEIANKCKKFYPLRKVEIYKTELMKRPTTEERAETKEKKEEEETGKEKVEEKEIEEGKEETKTEEEQTEEEKEKAKEKVERKKKKTKNKKEKKGEKKESAEE